MRQHHRAHRWFIGNANAKVLPAVRALNDLRRSAFANSFGVTVVRIPMLATANRNYLLHQMSLWLNRESGRQRGSIPQICVGTCRLDAGSSPAGDLRAFSSVGKSRSLITIRSQVRVLQGPLIK